MATFVYLLHSLTDCIVPLYDGNIMNETLLYRTLRLVMDTYYVLKSDINIRRAPNLLIHYLIHNLEHTYLT